MGRTEALDCQALCGVLRARQSTPVFDQPCGRSMALSGYPQLGRQLARLVDAHTLLPALLASFQADLAFAYAKGGGEKDQELRVGAPLQRWRAEADFQPVTVQPGEGIRAGLGLQVAGE